MNQSLSSQNVSCERDMADTPKEGNFWLMHFVLFVFLYYLLFIDI